MAHQAQKKWKIWGGKDNTRVKKVLIVANYMGIELDVPAFIMGETNKTPEFLRMNPIGRVPVLETPQGAIFESNSIARFLALQDESKKLIHGDAFRRAQISEWLDFAGTTIDPYAGAWLYPIWGYAEFNAQLHEKAQVELKRAFEALNRHLETRTFLVGERLSLADIIVAVSLFNLYKIVLEPRWRAPYVNVNRWFELITAQEKFSSVMRLEPNQWCTVALKAKTTTKAAEAAPKAQEKHEEEKHEETKEAEKAPAKAAGKGKGKKKDEDEEEEEEAPQEEKKKNPLDLLPKSSFILDEFKREFSNKPLDEALEYLYKNFDPAGYTMWFAKYKYNDELTKTFMSANLIGGFFQRMDRMRKYAFGVMSIYGVDSAHEISGYWVIRGTGESLPEPMQEVDDTEHYNWTRIDTANLDDATKTKIRAYLEGNEIDGKPYADGKTFK